MTPIRAALLTFAPWFVLVHAPVLRAQTTDSALTLSRALSLAEAHGPRLHGRQAEVEGARSAVTLTNERLLPTLDLGGQVMRATDNNTTGASFPQSVLLPVSGPVRLTADGSMVYGSGLGAVLAWTPFTFGQVSSQRRQARAELSLALDNVSVESFDLRVRVSAAYLDLLRDRELMRVQEQSLARAEALSRSVRTLVASGLRPAADSQLSNADLSRSRIDVFIARRNAATTASRLSELLGSWLQVPPLDGAPFLQTLPAGADTSALVNASSADLSRHPRLQTFAARVAVSDARQAVVARSALPRVSLLGGVTARGSGIAADGDIDHSLSGAFAGERTNLATGFMVSVPLMDALFTGPRAGVERGRAEADRAERLAQEDHLRAELSAANADFTLALQTSAEVPVQLAAAAAAYQQLNARYTAGLATQAELAQAKYLLTRAEGDNVAARISAWTAWLNVCAARGDLAPFLRNAK